MKLNRDGKVLAVNEDVSGKTGDINMKNVKWVTACEDSGPLSGMLTDGKDYKVESINPELKCYKVVNDAGYKQEFHYSWFDKPSTYKKKEVECYDEDFDDLVYNKVTKDGYGYFYIRLDALSEEQKQHFKKYCCRNRTDFLNPTQDILMTSWDNRELHWWTNRSDLAVMSHPSCEEVSFNGIFKHRDEV